MTREECIYYLGKVEYMDANEKEAIDMAIEALQEPKTIIAMDPQYKNDKGFAMVFNGIDNKLVLEEVHEITAVVRCENCRHANECHKSVHYTRNELNTVAIGYSPIEWCSHGERK